MKINIHINYNATSNKKAAPDIIKFIPEEANVKWNDIEIHPIFQDLNGYCDVVEEGKEHFGVFLSIKFTVVQDVLLMYLQKVML
jgi:hypothetical protein